MFQDKLIGAALLLVGIIHVLPLAGLSGADRLQSLYGVTISDPNMLVLMRHRAVLFGLLGAGCLYAAFDQRFAVPALAAGFVSVAAFLAIAYQHAPLNDAVRRVVVVDWVALAVLVAATARWLLTRT
jgi:hypothetical protein